MLSLRSNSAPYSLTPGTSRKGVQRNLRSESRTTLGPTRPFSGLLSSGTLCRVWIGAPYPEWDELRTYPDEIPATEKPCQSAAGSANSHVPVVASPIMESCLG